MSTPEDPFKALLANQLQMNPQTWAQLQARGVDENTLLVLDFFYTARSKSQAEALVAFLRDKTTFSAEALMERGFFLRKRWRVAGKTKPSTTSVPMLDDWVEFMVKAGAKHGLCHFDGWGVQIAAAAVPADGTDGTGAVSPANGTVAALAAERSDEPGREDPEPT